MKFPIRYFISLTAVVLLSAFIAWGLIQVFDWPIPQYGIAIFTVIYVVSFLSHMLVNLASLWSGKPFIQMTVLSMVIRMTVYILLILLLLLLSRKTPTVDIVYFGIIYLILTIHEVIFTLRNPPTIESLD